MDETQKIDSGLSLYRAGSLNIAVFSRRTRAEDFHVIDTWFSDVANRVQGPLLHLSIIDVPSREPMDAQARKAAVDTLQSMRTRVVALARVVPVSGFRGALIQSVVSSISQLAAVSCPQKHFRDTRSALQWLAQRGEKAGATVDVATLHPELCRLLSPVMSTDAHEAVGEAVVSEGAH